MSSFTKLATVTGALAVLLGCTPEVTVWLENDTQDNIEPDCAGHLAKGDAQVVATFKEVNGVSTTEICRSYGTIAVLTLISIGVPEDEDTSVTVVLTEPWTDHFEVAGGGDFVAASVTSPLTD